VLDTLRFSISLEQEFPDLYLKGKRVSGYDAVIPRIGPSITYYGVAVLRQFEQIGSFCLNQAFGIVNSRDKLRSLQILSRHNVGIPPTAFVRARDDILPAIERVGGAPVIIKLLEGSQGVGVILAESTKVAQAIVETLQSARQNVLIQKFVAESKGKDVRAFVVGDRVIAAMRRVAQGQEFRSNVHRGATPEGIRLDPVYEATAVRATQILGLRVAGVDMLEGKDGPQIAEVNSSPGLEGIEQATGVDVAGAVFEYIADHVMFPELDVRQRLTVTKGYGITEVMVPKDSPLVGKTLAEAQLREQDITVLTLERKSGVISNPKGERRIRARDRLVCYGKLDAIKALIPTRRRRRGKKWRKAAVELVQSDTDWGQSMDSDTGSNWNTQ
jgi:ribosomal protein S6--L-glutamate ligase